MESILKELPIVHHWNKYNPTEFQYLKYDPGIIAMAHKIIDVYRAFCIARSNLVFYECNDFGEMIRKNDKRGKKYLKSTLLLNALIYYNICIDLSWQVVWFNS